MHEEFMESYGGYLKKNYLDLDRISRGKLCEAKDIACVMKAIFEADKEYNIVKAMEEGSLDDIELSMEELIPRLKKLFESATTEEKVEMKTEITKIINA